MTIHMKPSEEAKYCVIVFNGKNLPPVLHQSPTVCSFYGTGNFATTKKEAKDLAKDMSSHHPNRIYQVVKLDFVYDPSMVFGE